MMDNQTLIEMLMCNEMTYKYFGGVMACDNLPKNKVEGKKYFIINSEKRESGKYGHWIVLFFSSSGCEFFDSLAKKIDSYDQLILDFIMNNCTGSVSYNDVQLQPTESNKCGKYCLFFIYVRCKGESFLDSLAYFKTNLNENDVLVDQFFESLKKFKNPFCLL